MSPTCCSTGNSHSVSATCHHRLTVRTINLKDCLPKSILKHTKVKCPSEDGSSRFIDVFLIFGVPGGCICHEDYGLEGWGMTRSES